MKISVIGGETVSKVYPIYQGENGRMEALTPQMRSLGKIIAP